MDRQLLQVDSAVATAAIPFNWNSGQQVRSPGRVILDSVDNQISSENAVPQDDINPYKAPLNPDKSPLSPKDSHDIGRDDRLIVLATFGDSISAHLLRNELLDNQIFAAVNNELVAPVFGATIAGQTSAFWVEVSIRMSDAEAALEIKQRFLESRLNEDSTIPEWVCQCGETVDRGFSVCWNCEADYPSPTK